jgi:hypothetical protein
MKTSARTVPFLKTATCPASKILLALRGNTLSKKAAKQVSEHLESCDFCNAERQLLAHHTLSRKGSKTPEIPMNLRILAEAILSRR